MLYLTLSGLRLHVTGLNNADDLMTVFFFAKTNFPQREVYWSSFYTKHYLIQFKVAHFSAKWVRFSVFAAENLNHRFRFNERKQAEAKQIRAPSRVTPLMQPEITVAHSLRKKLMLFSGYW